MSDPARFADRITTAAWHASLCSANVGSIAAGRTGMLYSVVVVDGLPKDLDQPALVDDVISVHLSGAKRVTKTEDGHRSVHDVAFRSVTVIPRHSAIRWTTEGPIGFAHLSLEPGFLNDVCLREVGRPRTEIELVGLVGDRTELVVGLALELIRIGSSSPPSRLYTESMSTAFALALLRHGSSARIRRVGGGDAGGRTKGGMAAWRLRRVTDYIAENFQTDIALAELAEASGLSRAHFFRAFGQATGTTPGRYLM